MDHQPGASSPGFLMGSFMDLWLVMSKSKTGRGRSASGLYFGSNLRLDFLQ
jgi:hypothetical protein